MSIDLDAIKARAAAVETANSDVEFITTLVASANDVPVLMEHVEACHVVTRSPYTTISISFNISRQLLRALGRGGDIATLTEQALNEIRAQLYEELEGAVNDEVNAEANF